MHKIKVEVEIKTKSRAKKREDIFGGLPAMGFRRIA
jgi:hypothetical protein